MSFKKEKVKYFSKNKSGLNPKSRVDIFCSSDSPEIPFNKTDKAALTEEQAVTKHLKCIKKTLLLPFQSFFVNISLLKHVKI